MTDCVQYIYSIFGRLSANNKSYVKEPTNDSRSVKVSRSQKLLGHSQGLSPISSLFSRTRSEESSFSVSMVDSKSKKEEENEQRRRARKRETGDGQTGYEAGPKSHYRPVSISYYASGYIA